jgi:hypothetical protein
MAMIEIVKGFTVGKFSILSARAFSSLANKENVSRPISRRLESSQPRIADNDAEPHHRLPLTSRAKPQDARRRFGRIKKHFSVAFDFISSGNKSILSLVLKERKHHIG